MAGTGTGTPGTSVWGAIGAAAAVLSAAAAFAALLVSFQSLRIARDAQTALHLQQREQIASRVYLSEAPHYAYAHAPQAWLTALNGHPGYVVMNASTVQVNQVWIEGPHHTSVNIWGLQGCSLYALPPGFQPIAVDFADPYGHWRRTFAGTLTSHGKPMPAEATDGSPWWADARSCT